MGVRKLEYHALLCTDSTGQREDLNPWLSNSSKPAGLCRREHDGRPHALDGLWQPPLRGLFTHLDIKYLRLEGPATYTKLRIQSYLETFSRVNKNNHFNYFANKSLSKKKRKGKVMLFFPLQSKGYNNIFLWADVRAASRHFFGNHLHVSVWKVPCSD